MQTFAVAGVSQITIPSFSIRCPACRKVGVAEVLGGPDWCCEPNKILIGLRRCPDPQCRTLLFIAFKDGRVVNSYPPERIDFDATNIPKRVLASIEEAILCHANQCFVAAAIMVRKTLEELCLDRNVEGGTLKERIKALGGTVILPPPLLTGLDDLRLLSNDAAHIESQAYNQVGQEEVEVAIEFSKEVLKAIYQYEALLARLKGLKRTLVP